jgi:2-methylisocitrate lyase-like PEP mutase family enzyme
MGLRGVLLSLEELSGLGVKRVSLGSSLFRSAIGAFLRAAREMCDRGTFSFTEQSASPREIGAMFER